MYNPIIVNEVEKGEFVERVNRFTLRCKVDGRSVFAYLPNPGRLWELLLYGRTVVLLRNKETGKLPYTVIAVERDGLPILLHTHLTNYIVEKLLSERRIPGLRNLVVTKREIWSCDSRYDFLLTDGKEEHFLEVKTCTLFEGRISMFPDAITERGTRHIEGLIELSMKGYKTHILFVVMYPRARYFLPAYHIDLNFTDKLLWCKDIVDVRAISIKLKGNLYDVVKVKELDIPWELIKKEATDGGSYIIIYQLKKNVRMEVGEAGMIYFRSGFYLYVGSAKKGLKERLSRHRRKIKKLHWHIDYLAQKASFFREIPIRTRDDIECEIAKELRSISREVDNFGSSDCECTSHLFYMDKNPIFSPEFIQLIQHFRLKRLEEKLP